MTKQMNFELGSRVKKDVFRFFSHELRQRKPCRFPHEIKPQTFGFRAPMLCQGATENPMMNSGNTVWVSNMWKKGYEIE